jgi:hypothetical protein
MNRYSTEKLNRVISAKITEVEHNQLQSIAMEYHKCNIIEKPSVTEILRYVVRQCINVNFPNYNQGFNNPFTLPKTGNNSQTYMPSYYDFLRQI